MSPDCGRTHLLLFAAIIICGGCSSMPTSPMGSGLARLLGPATKQTPEDRGTNADPPAVCHVEIRKNKTKKIDVPLSAESRVQDILTASKANKAFRKPDAFLLRPTGNPSEPMLKLVCNYDAKSQQVSLETDYAVMSGDTLIVREHPIGPMDEMLSSLLGLGR